MSKLQHFLLLLAFTSLLMPLLAISPATRIEEQRILLKIKQIFGNPPSLESWKPSSSSPCDWLEISCSNGTVTYISLGRKNISTTLPRIICDLPNLQGIDLSDNHIPGNFPDFLCSCKKLNRLDLSWNNFLGPIPDDIQCLSGLRYLNLGHNNFYSIPKGIGQLQELTSLAINGNRLRTIPVLEIGNLSNLEELSLSVNEGLAPDEIPLEFAGLKKLKSLSMGQTNLIGEIPQFIVVNLTNLEALDLSDNRLAGSIPGGFNKLHNLQTLLLGSNQFSGSLPSGIVNPNLKVLDLSSNRLFGVVPDEYEKADYTLSFSENLDLCTDNKILQLPLCTKKKAHMFFYILAAIFGFILASGLSVYFLAKKYGQHRRKVHTNDIPEWESIWFHKLNFTESDILSSLSENNLIGRGGSGKVYRIIINPIGEKVAVKRVWNDKKSDQRLEREFLAEVQVLGMIRHCNIVKLLGCISSKTTKLLIYEYMENQSLDKWLHKKAGSTTSEACDSTPGDVLDWPTRLRIAIGTAQGLCYMHHDCSPPIVHRDIKSSNILLDSGLNAKIADYGLAKVLVKEGEPETASAVAGTFGYIAPEYAYTSKLNVKSDVYSFGVVLLELTTGRQPIIVDEQMNLVQWAWQHYEEEKSIITALDEEIMEPCYLETMTAAFKLGLKCTSPSPSQRPAMNEILQILLSCPINFPSWQESSVVLTVH